MTHIDEYRVIQSSTPEWEEIYAIAQQDKEHWLWENYQNIDLADYEHMIVNVRDDIPAAFHGIYNNGRWPSNISRICNRAYINPHFRNLGQGLEITSKNIKFVLDNYEKWNKDILFISRGVQYNNIDISWQKFEKFCKFLQKTVGYELVYDSYLYQCCPKQCKDCYQFCVWYDPQNLRNDLDIKRITKDHWNTLEL